MTVALALGYPLLIGGFLWFVRDLIRSHDAERAKLLNRIQAPQQAVARSVAEESKDDPLVPAFIQPDSDEAFWDYKKTLTRDGSHGPASEANEDG